jgi:hypothetical protein
VLALVAALSAWLAFGVGKADGDKRANKAELALSHVQRDAAQQVASAEAKYRRVEQARTEAVNQAANEYERGLQDGKARADVVIAGLVDGTRRLRHEIAAYATERLSRDSAAPGELSEEALRGAESLGAVVRVVAEQDAQIRGLQDAYEALRRPAP